MGHLPFGREEFLDVIAAYNVAAALSFLWLRMGVVFHTSASSAASTRRPPHVR